MQIKLKGNDSLLIFFSTGWHCIGKWLPSSFARCYQFSLAPICFTFFESQHSFVEPRNHRISHNNKSNTNSISSFASTSSYRIIKIDWQYKFPSRLVFVCILGTSLLEVHLNWKTKILEIFISFYSLSIART